MKTHVVSGFHPAGYQTYGKTFLETFDKFWPAAISLTVMGEEPVPMQRGRFIPLFLCEGLEEFIARHKNDPVKCGRGSAEYNFRLDAVKFCRQGFIPRHVAQGLPDGHAMVWLDADVMTFAPVPRDLIDRLLGDADLCYLGRKGIHSEIGFWACRLNHRSRLFIEHFWGAYQHDVLFEFKEWHSAFVFDEVRRLHEQSCGLVARNLTPNGGGHVWFQSELGRYTDHLKGDKRKAAGRSAERRTAIGIRQA